MSNLVFDTDWLDGEGIGGTELAATFASLRIQVIEKVVTRVLDERTKTVRDCVYVPLYPLAEWLAANWWFLAYEFEDPVRAKDPEFRRRHELGPNSEGYAFPNLAAAPSEAGIHLRWGSAPSPWTRVEFLDSGKALVDRDEFRKACADLIDRVVQRLASSDIHGTFLQEEWAAIQGADEEESRFCETAAALGWDPYDLDDLKRDQVIQLAGDANSSASQHAVGRIAEPHN